MFCIRLFHSIPASPPARLAAPWVRDRPVRSTQNDCDTIAAERGQIRAPSTYASYFSVLGVPKPQRLPVHLISSWPIRLGTARDTRTSSNTSLSLYCVSALHSTYFTAPRSFAMRSPSSFRTGCIFCLASFSRTLGSSLRSTCVPTMRQGTPGQWWCTSGNHFSRTFSKDAGEVTLKQTRKTSVCGYDRGRNRS